MEIWERMAISLLWMTSVLMTSFLVSRHNCDPVTTLGQIRETNPQKMVEIIELMLSQTPKDKEQNVFGIQKVPQDAPNYEILITPNKNLQELKGSQKIKIFVEADDSFDALDGKTTLERKKTIEETDKNGKQNIFDVLPLSIESMGLNVQQFQQSDIPIVRLTTQNENDEFPQKDFESYPSKRQTNWGSSSKSNGRPKNLGRQADIKEVTIQREPSYVDQNNPQQPVSGPKKGVPQRSVIYDGDYSSSSQNGKRIPPQSSFSSDYVNPLEEVERPQSRPAPKDYRRTYESTYQETPIYEEVRPSNERRQVNREQEDVRPSNDRRPTYSRDEEDYGSSGSRKTNVYRETDSRRPSYEREEVRPSNERRPVYREPEEVRPTRYPEYDDERPTNARRPTNVREPAESRPTNERRPTRPAHEKKSSRDDYDEIPQTGNSRPFREDSQSYSGFPESFQPDVSNHYSRPLQSEPARAFPASPCFNVFKYEGREPDEDRWYADIYISTDEVLNGVRLDIRLDRPAELVTNWFSGVKTKDSLLFTIFSLTHKLVPGPAETVRIMVKFNAKQPVPYLKSIHLNGRMICPGNRAQKTTTRKPVYENPGDLHIRRTTETYSEVPKRPSSFVEPERITRKTTGRPAPVYEETRRTTVRPPPPPPEYIRPNPNVYEETDQNSFNTPTKKPPPRPQQSKPTQATKPTQTTRPTQTTKPTQSSKPVSSQNQGQGQSTNKKPSSSSSGSKPTQTQSGPIPQGLPKEIPCGTPAVQPRPLVTHGQQTARGQWPWHVALYRNVGTDLSFFCGGSLINTKYVLTAAHCVTTTYRAKPVDETTLVVYLGKYHLRMWSEGGVQSRQVSKIHVHPKYNGTHFSSDIAVIELSSPVEYTDYIRPICMWDRSNTRIEDVEGKIGTVVGWGNDENSKLTEQLMQAKMPVVEQKTCLWSYPDFYPQFTSNTTFCAGFKNGTSVCNGDSGGALAFQYKDKTGVERWHVRGIVSISPARNDKRTCDTSQYVVFTDVAKFLPWVDNFLS